LVLKGGLIIDLPVGPVTMHPDEIFQEPKGKQRCPRATIETHLLLIEPTGAPKIGDSATAAKRVTI
jgi:hypothetical protein